MRLFRTYYSLTNFSKMLLLQIIPLTIAWYFLPSTIFDYLICIYAAGLGFYTFNTNKI